MFFSNYRRPLLAYAACALLFAVPASATTLEEAMEIAVNTHPKVLGVIASKKASEEEVKEARSAFFPSLDLRVQAGNDYVNSPATRGRSTRPHTFDGRNTGPVSTLHKEQELAFTQMLFDGFDAWNRTDAAQRRVEVVRYQIHDAREEIGLRAILAYLQVVRSRAVVRFSEENIGKHRNLNDIVKKKVSAGGAGSGALYQTETRLALAKARLVQFSGELRDAESDYLEVIGVMPDELELKNVLLENFPASVDEAIIIAKEGNPAFNAATKTLSALKADHEAAKSPFWPTVNIELTQTRSEDTGGTRGPRMEYQSLLVMRYNLFKGGRDLALKRRALELVSKARQSEAETWRLVEKQMRVDYNALTVMNDKLPLLEKREIASAKSVVTYREQYLIGARSLLNILDVENELFQARIDYVEGLLQHRFAQYRVLATMGRLLKTLGVKVKDAVE